MLKRLRAKSRKNQKGFTLIELLAVIVILAIIAAIAIPSVVSIISRQNDKAAVQSAINAIHAAKLYVADHNTTSDITLYTGTASGSSSDTLAPYVDKAGSVNGNFTVQVTFSGGTASYAITSGLTVGTSGGISGLSGLGESDLIKFNRGN